MQRGCHESRHMLSYSVDEGRCRDHSSEDLKRTAYKRSARPAGRRAPLVCVSGPFRCSLSPSYLARSPKQAHHPHLRTLRVLPPPSERGRERQHRGQSPLVKGDSPLREALPPIPRPEKRAQHSHFHSQRSKPKPGKRADPRETSAARFSKQRAALPFAKQLANHSCVRVAVPQDTSPRETGTARFSKEREAFPDTRPLPRGQNGHGGCNAHRTPLLGSPPMMRNAVARMVGSRFPIPLQRREPASRACMARTLRITT